MAGQSWTVHNIGKRIMFGGLSLTIMHPTGLPSAYPNPALPPYQFKINRRVYSAPGKYKLKPNYFAGGYNVFGQDGVWHNGKDLAVSWLQNTFYIKGKYSTIAAVPNTLIVGACLYRISPDDPFFPSGLRLVVVFRNLSTSVITVRQYVVTDNNIYLLNLTLTSIKTLPALSSASSYSSFDYSGKHLVRIYHPNNLAIDYETTECLRKKIDVLTFSEDYSSYTVSNIYNEIEQGYHSIATSEMTRIPHPITGVLMNVAWTGTVTGSLSAGSSIKQIVSITDSINLVATDYSSYISSTNANNSYLDQIAHEDQTADSSGSFTISTIKMDFTGATLESTLIPAVYSVESSYTFVADGDFNGDFNSQLDHTTIQSYPRVSVYPFNNAVILLDSVETTNVSSTSTYVVSIEGESTANSSSNTAYTKPSFIRGYKKSEATYELTKNQDISPPDYNFAYTSTEMPNLAEEWLGPYYDDEVDERWGAGERYGRMTLLVTVVSGARTDKMLLAQASSSLAGVTNIYLLSASLKTGDFHLEEGEVWNVPGQQISPTQPYDSPMGVTT